ncbi:hypothetical protein MAXJ12_27688 [Mesorhizobium alhagi CCNWXJ12-2]|uniref:Uncharacterized protein n=1 Tax=Mesorhizobium alhagi CCNWXJ12-2 TaxID=1107882 RepID=H0HZA1_9HYPH|nr:hypothetical protein MAXJ12_27688 [Mesorhizobium alhagi CCNWXJ12-2]
MGDERQGLIRDLLAEVFKGGIGRITTLAKRATARETMKAWRAITLSPMQSPMQ